MGTNSRSGRVLPPVHRACLLQFSTHPTTPDCIANSANLTHFPYLPKPCEQARSRLLGDREEPRYSIKVKCLVRQVPLRNHGFRVRKVSRRQLSRTVSPMLKNLTLYHPSLANRKAMLRRGKATGEAAVCMA